MAWSLFTVWAWRKYSSKRNKHLNSNLHKWPECKVPGPGGANKHLLTLELSQGSTGTHYIYLRPCFTHINTEPRRQKCEVGNHITYHQTAETKPKNTTIERDLRVTVTKYPLLDSHFQSPCPMTFHLLFRSLHSRRTQHTIKQSIWFSVCSGIWPAPKPTLWVHPHFF